MQKIIRWFALAAVVFLAGLLSGWTIHSDRVEAQELKQVKAAVEKTQEGQTKINAIAEAQAVQQSEQAIKDRIITREVVKYVEVTPKSDRCMLPGAWRGLHDSAALGQPADPASMAIAQADPVTDATALATVTENYIGCRGAIAQVEGWQEWWGTAKNYCGVPGHD